MVVAKAPRVRVLLTANSTRTLLIVLVLVDMCEQVAFVSDVLYQVLDFVLVRAKRKKRRLRVCTSTSTARSSTARCTPVRAPGVV